MKNKLKSLYKIISTTLTFNVFKKGYSITNNAEPDILPYSNAIYFKLSLLVFSFCLYTLCYLLLIHNSLNWDLSWHIEAAKRMFAGGSYLTNLCDDNSPPVFMFYIPLILIRKIHVFSNYHFIYIYIFLIFAIANYFTYVVLNCKPIDTYSKIILYFFGLILIFFLGNTIFGARENVIFCLLLPYLYMNLIDDGKLSKINQACIACLASIAIMQLPFYLIATISIDAVECIAKRQKLEFYQVLFYLLCLFLFIVSFTLYSEYYLILLNLLYHFQAGLNQSISEMINNNLFCTVFIGFFIVLFFTVYYKSIVLLKILLMIFFSVLIYFFEHKFWFYHLYPAICVMSLGFMFVHIENRKQPEKLCFPCVIKKALMCFFIYIIFIDFLVTGSWYVSSYKVYNNDNSTLNKLITFARSTDPKQNSTLFLEIRVTPAYLVSIYGGLNIVSPWANMWMLPTLIQYANMPANIKDYSVGKEMLFKLTLTTLKQKPYYIIYQNNIKQFDMLNYLGQDPKIHKMLTHYSQYKIINQFVILKKIENVKQ